MNYFQGSFKTEAEEYRQKTLTEFETRTKWKPPKENPEQRRHRREMAMESTPQTDEKTICLTSQILVEATTILERKAGQGQNVTWLLYDDEIPLAITEELDLISS
jgi:hypothetical protein